MARKILLAIFMGFLMLGCFFLCGCDSSTPTVDGTTEAPLHTSDPSPSQDPEDTGNKEPEKRDGWLLPSLPEYVGGTLSKRLYACGSESFGKNMTGTTMQLVSQTSEAEYSQYCNTLLQAGYVIDFQNQIENNLFASFNNGTNSAYVYYNASEKCTRIIYSKKVSKSVEEFGYSYEKQALDTTTLYSYGLVMSADGSDIKDNKKTCSGGQLWMVKLADNSLFVIDGGDYRQFDNVAIDGLYEFMREITATPIGEKVRISAWFISHAHGDHIGGMARMLSKYHSQITIERLMVNFPSTAENTCFSDALSSNNSPYKKLSGYLESWYPNIDVHKLKTGEKIQLADVQIEVMNTHADLVDPVTARSTITDFNDSSTSIKLYFDGKTALILGDTLGVGATALTRNYPGTALKCDIIQAAHHGIDFLKGLYDHVAAPIAIIPQSSGGMLKNTTRKQVRDCLSMHADMVFYGGDQTVGLQVSNGVLQAVTIRGVMGGIYTGWSW